MEDGKEHSVVESNACPSILIGNSSFQWEMSLQGDGMSQTL
jgi:hypothetical protein